MNKFVVLTLSFFCFVQLITHITVSKDVYLPYLVLIMCPLLITFNGNVKSCCCCVHACLPAGCIVSKNKMHFAYLRRDT